MTSSEDDIIPGRKFALYECTGGDKPHTFESLKPKKKETSRTCRKHDTEAKRVEYRDLRKSDIPDNKRLYGRFECSCLDDNGKRNHWGSAYAWKGYYQECNRCKEEVYTWDLSFLRRGNGNNDKSHMVHLCGKCKSLKRPCGR